ncbi:restriction endonuclease subunit S [Streptomyces griseoviridis]|uniref:restriction endonuclease subunit S n=1 Tax=Streptomyces TaxID=1883 RepID=UPI0024746BF3|nr:restriction endonuclease subunit S [Streptomyces sp. MAA16]MDH6703067.1 type I restriction enzyme S subunit [Streptomyces sp. MAA16]
MSYAERPLGEALRLACDKTDVQASGTYEIAGVRGFGRGLFERETISGTGTQYRTLHRLHADTLVLSKLKAFEGAIAVIPDRFEGKFLSPEFPTFSIDSSKADTRYLRHLCAWPGLWLSLAEKSTGIGSRRERVSPQQLLATKVPLPDLSEQCHIAARLDVAMAKLAHIEELRKSTTRGRDALRESLISTANKATTRPLDTVMTLTRRPVEVSASAEYQEIGLRSFGRGVFHKPPISGAELGAKKIFHIKSGDLLFSSVFAWEGAVARAGAAELDRVGSHRFMTYVVDPSIADADYLRFYFLSAPGLEILRRCSPGGAGRNKTLGIKPFGAEMIPLPSLSEQQHHARVLLSAEAISQDRGPVLDAQIQATRTALLNAAFTGKL